jgi:methionine-rich copper-binding protein CopC
MTMKPVMRMLGALVVLAMGQAVLAHTMLEHANPAVGSSVHGAPAKVELWFTEELEPSFSALKVIDANGRQVDRMNQEVDRSDSSHLRVSLPVLSPGVYRVVWRAVSVDSHVTEGDYTFELVP